MSCEAADRWFGMTTFAEGFRVQVVCEDCKRHGTGHGGPCACNVVTLPVQAASEPAADEPDAFTLAQEERDDYARAEGRPGDRCRRWTRCGWQDCAVQSPEMEWYWQTDAWETEHECFGCNHRVDAGPLEIDDDTDYLWPHPQPHPWRHRMEPLQERVHVHKPDTAGLAFVSSRTPAVMPKKAA